MARKKTLDLPLSVRQNWVKASKNYSIRRQCRLAKISRSHCYYESGLESKENLLLMRLMDEQFLKHPEYGYPRMTDWLRDQGHLVNQKRVSRLMRVMGIQAITPGPHTSKPSREHKKYPYLLRNVKISKVGHVWSSDITYIPTKHGYMYLVAIIDWFSRYVLGWDLSNTLESDFCIEALRHALDGHKNPEIFNSDQGVQFTSEGHTSVLKDAGIKISMDGKGRALDNVYIERLWWTVKYENIYPKVYRNVTELYQGLKNYFSYYNGERKHSSLEKKTPAEIFFQGDQKLEK